MRTPLTKGRASMWAALVSALAILGAAAVGVQAGAGNASVHLKKDTNGLFILTVSDPDGIKSFSFATVTRGSYGGDVGGCPRTFQSTNVLFSDPADFTPVMAATITDCQDNADELEIPPPEAGAAKSKRPKPPPPPPAAAPEAAPPPAAEAVSPPSGQAAAEQAATEEAKAKISYPVTELGNCGSEAACRAHCEELANIKACIAYAETHGLITAGEAEQGRRFAEIGGRGPGGCTSRESCVAYCEDVSRIEECLDFAEKNGFLTGKELAEVRAVAKVKREGVAFPGGCTSKAACEAYCQDADHIDECIAFGERSGLIPPEELEMAKKFMPLIKEGKTPGGCTSKAACEAYCQGPTNMRQCLAFAEEQGLIPPEELEMAKKFMPLMESGETPGGCRSKEQCEAYCGGEGHLEECLEFGIKGGFISTADAELARKTGGKGPGDCKSKEACEAFCQQPENLETCQAFALEHGFDAGGGPGGIAGGPGGCKNQEECMAYCQANPQECQGFGPPGGGPPGGPGGFPGGGPGGPGGPGGGFPGGDTSGFAECGITSGAPASFVCGTNNVTYFNECHAKSHGLEIAHGGVCLRTNQEGEEESDTPCTTVADPVCGTDGVSYVHECHAREQGAQVKYKGGCRSEPPGFPGGGIPSGADYVGPGGCRTPDECIRYCKVPEHEKECNEFKTPSTTPRAPGRGPGGQSDGPGGCASVEECREYCHANQKVCDDFVSEDVPPEGKCQAGFQIERDALGYKYCNPLSCPPGQEFITDVFGRRACAPAGIPSGAGGLPSVPPAGGGMPGGGFPSSPDGFPAAPGGFPAVPGFTPPEIPGAVPPSGGSEPPYEYKVDCSLFAAAPSCSYVGPVGSQNYNYCVQCFPDRAAPSLQVPPPSSAAPAASLFGLLIAPFLELFR